MHGYSGRMWARRQRGRVVDFGIAWVGYRQARAAQMEIERAELDLLAVLGGDVSNITTIATEVDRREALFKAARHSSVGAGCGENLRAAALRSVRADVAAGVLLAEVAQGSGIVQAITRRSACGGGAA